MATLFSDKPMAVAASSLAFIIAVRAKEAGAHPDQQKDHGNIAISNQLVIQLCSIINGNFRILKWRYCTI